MFRFLPQTTTGMISFLLGQAGQFILHTRLVHMNQPVPHITPTIPPGAPSPLELLEQNISTGNIDGFYDIFCSIATQNPQPSLDSFNPSDHVNKLLLNIQSSNACTVISLHKLWHFIQNQYSIDAVVFTLLEIHQKMSSIISILDIDNITSLAAYAGSKDLLAQIDARKAAIDQEEVDKIVMESRGVGALGPEEQFYIIGASDTQEDAEL